MQVEFTVLRSPPPPVPSSPDQSVSQFGQIACLDDFLVQRSSVVIHLSCELQLVTAQSLTSDGWRSCGVSADFGPLAGMEKVFVVVPAVEESDLWIMMGTTRDAF